MICQHIDGKGRKRSCHRPIHGTRASLMKKKSGAALKLLPTRRTFFVIIFEASLLTSPCQATGYGRFSAGMESVEYHPWKFMRPKYSVEALSLVMGVVAD